MFLDCYRLLEMFIIYLYKETIYHIHLQTPFNEVSVRVIGDDSAPTLFHITQAGVIQVKKGANLISEKETEYKVKVW